MPGFLNASAYVDAECCDFCSVAGGTGQGGQGRGERARASLVPTFKDCCISAGKDGFPWPGGDGNWDNWDNWDRWDRRCCDGTHINFEVGDRDGWFWGVLAASCADLRDNRAPVALGTLGTGVSVGMER